MSEALSEDIALDAAGLLERTDGEPVDFDAELAEAADSTFGSKVPFWVKITIAVVVVVAFFVSFALGHYAMSPVEVVQGVWNHFTGAIASLEDAKADRVLFNIRLDRRAHV